MKKQRSKTRRTTEQEAVAQLDVRLATPDAVPGAPDASGYEESLRPEVLAAEEEYRRLQELYSRMDHVHRDKEQRARARREEYARLKEMGVEPKKHRKPKRFVRDREGDVLREDRRGRYDRSQTVHGRHLARLSQQLEAASGLEDVSRSEALDTAFALRALVSRFRREGMTAQERRRRARDSAIPRDRRCPRCGRGPLLKNRSWKVTEDGTAVCVGCVQRESDEKELERVNPEAARLRRLTWAERKRLAGVEVHEEDEEDTA